MPTRHVIDEIDDMRKIEPLQELPYVSQRVCFATERYYLGGKQDKDMDKKDKDNNKDKKDKDTRYGFSNDQQDKLHYGYATVTLPLVSRACMHRVFMT